MAKTCLVVKATRKPKHPVQAYYRCKECGRPRGLIKKFQLCRICFRELACRGMLPGVVKSSW